MPVDDEVQRGLRRLFEAELQAAETNSARGVRPAVISRSGFRPGLIALLVVAFAAYSAMRAWPVAGPSTAIGTDTPTAAPSSSLASGAPSARPTATLPLATATPAPILGTFANGLPSSVNGEPVLLLPSAVKALVAAKTDQSVLVGGWFQSTAPSWFCPAFGFDQPWGPCLRFAVHQTSTGEMAAEPGNPIWLYGEAPNETILVYPGSLLIEDVAPYASTRPVVLSIHTHDPQCTNGLKILGVDCSAHAVLDAVAWTGNPN